MVNPKSKKITSKPFLWLPLLLVLLAYGCGDGGVVDKTDHTFSGDSEGLLVLNTSRGDIKIRLFEETPGHKANVEELVGQGFYDSLSFHRVVNGELIQGGDPFSKVPEKQDSLGQGGPGYDIHHEINPEKLHFRGAVAAARNPDLVNKYRNSSGSQFYIVIGKKWKSEELDMIEQQIQEDQKSFLYLDIMNRDENVWLNEENQQRLFRQSPDSFQIVMDSLDAIYNRELRDLEPFTYSKEQRLRYIKEGGMPFLDLQYTVFGEVVEGMDIVEGISRMPIEHKLLGRPAQQIRFSAEISD